MDTVSDYLVDVVKAMGATDIFGVPGDYNLDFLDHITHRSDVKWAGNANELDAAYMADGYARSKGFATFVTTFGVGELSAINGLAGSIAETVPVLEIVGAPNTTAQNTGELVHHTFGDGNFTRFAKTHAELGIKVVTLSFDHPVDDINAAVQFMLRTGKPVYMVLPIDVAKLPVNPALRQNVENVVKPQPAKPSKAVLDRLQAELKTAQQPVILVGNEIANRHLGAPVASFIQNTDIPFADLGFGKDAVDESLPQFIGTYDGQVSDPNTSKVVDAADLVITLGVKLTDLITGMFSQSFDETKTIALNNDTVSFFGQSREYVDGYDFAATVSALADLKGQAPQNAVNEPANITTPTPSDKPLTQDFYDEAIASFVEPGDTLVADQGTSFSGLSMFRLKKDTHFIAQPLWGSIGYAFPAMLGSQFADRDHRSILATGEGSLQLTTPEFGMAFRSKLHPIMLVLDNDGYTVERLIHGMKESYNDVPKLKYTQFPDTFGAQESDYFAVEVRTENELIDALKKARNHPEQFALIQVDMPAEEAPTVLKKTGEMISANNNR